MQGDFADFTDDDIGLMEDYFDNLSKESSSDDPELFQSSRILGVHQGFSKDDRGSYAPEILRSSVVNGLANQYDRIANPNNPNRESPDRLVSSDKFYLMKIPIDLAVPSKRVESGNRPYSSGPIVVDRNVRGVGKKLEQMGYDPSVMILDGKHRHAEAIRNGDRQIFAYVGDQIIDRVQSRIMGERESARRRFDRLQAIIPNEIPNPEEKESVYIGLEVPREAASHLPLSLGSSATPSGRSDIPAHVTLVHISKKNDIDPNVIKIIEETCSYIAGETNKLRGQISGTFRFPATESSDNKEVVYAGVNVDGLKEMRQNLADILDLYNIPYSKNFSTYIPHITLEYVEQGEQTPDLNFEPVIVRFDSLYLSIGKDMKNYYFK